LRKYKEIYFNKKIEPEIQIKKAKCYGNGNGNGNNKVECVDMVDKEVNEFNELMKQKELFYVEMIPMVIADFIMIKGNYVVVNLDEDNKELNEKLHLEFDKKIWSKIIETNTNTNTNNNSFIYNENTKEQQHNNTNMISLLTLTKTNEQQKLNKDISISNSNLGRLFYEFIQFYGLQFEPSKYIIYIKSNINDDKEFFNYQVSIIYIYVYICI
jgi:hypothetical protein